MSHKVIFKKKFFLTIGCADGQPVGWTVFKKIYFLQRNERSEGNIGGKKKNLDFPFFYPVGTHPASGQETQFLLRAA